MFLLATLAAGAAEQGALPRSIVGGDAVAAKTYPFVVWVEGPGHHKCTGTIISRRWILTAASCLGGVTNPRIEHGYGSTLGFRSRESDRVVVHPDFRSLGPGKGYVNDIAVIRLRYEGGYPSEFAAPVAVPLESAEQSQAASGTTAIALGWGLRAGNRHSDTIRAFNANLYHAEYCRNQLAFQHEEQVAHEDTICAGTNAMHANSGDYGGPLIVQFTARLRSKVEWALVGIASMNAKDSSGATVTSIFTRVSSFADWIQEATDGAVVPASESVPIRPDPPYHVGPPPEDLPDEAWFRCVFPGGGSVSSTVKAIRERNYDCVYVRDAPAAPDNTDNTDDTDDPDETDDTQQPTTGLKGLTKAQLKKRLRKAEAELLSLRDTVRSEQARVGALESDVESLQSRRKQFNSLMLQLKYVQGQIHAVHATKEGLLKSLSTITAE